VNVANDGCERCWLHKDIAVPEEEVAPAPEAAPEVPSEDEVPELPDEEPPELPDSDQEDPLDEFPEEVPVANEPVEFAPLPTPAVKRENIKPIMRVVGRIRNSRGLYEGCPILCANGEPCAAALKEGKFVCNKPRNKPLERQLDGLVLEYTCEALDALCELEYGADWRPRGTMGFREEDIQADDDARIDEDVAVPTFKPKWCIYIENEQMCREPVHEKSHMCKEHRKHGRKFEHNAGTNRCFDPLWVVQRPFLELARTIAPNYQWFPHLNFYAHMTPKGPVVVGKAWSMIFPETLEICDVRRDVMYTPEGDEAPVKNLDHWMKTYAATLDPCREETSEELVRRCHNNGLLYKVLPQETLHFQFSLPTDLDTLTGPGFTSFEQLVRERPTLYIKYWNVWLSHIRRAKDFTRFMGASEDTLRRVLNIDDVIDWGYYFEVVGPKIGLYHVEVPAPTLEEVRAPTFNPFRYCRDWMRENAPERMHEPWFPPYHLLYPFPIHEAQWYRENRVRIEEIGDKHLYAHYNLRAGIRNSVKSWVQWLKYGRHEGEFRKLYVGRVMEDVYPPKLAEAVERAKADGWCR
jgi:hypothetical protein